jgi:hypothetical protein
VLGDIARDEGSDLLVDLVVLMMLVHSPDVVEDILVDHGPQLFVLDPHLSDQELYGAHRNQNVLGSENHDAPYTFLSKVVMKSRPELFHEFHDSLRDPA